MVEIHYPLKDSPLPFLFLICGAIFVFISLFSVNYIDFLGSLGLCFLSLMLLLIGVILSLKKEGRI
ncbi:MAG: hypothetical protein JSW00_11085 [Thermoplasmata archaeon]|nr:MAG: hypothetical protein JSW00_11085 [Thermoplasmata archaeon]